MNCYVGYSVSLNNILVQPDLKLRQINIFILNVCFPPIAQGRRWPVKFQGFREFTTNKTIAFQPHMTAMCTQGAYSSVRADRVYYTPPPLLLPTCQTLLSSLPQKHSNTYYTAIIIYNFFFAKSQKMLRQILERGGNSFYLTPILTVFIFMHNSSRLYFHNDFRAHSLDDFLQLKKT